MTITRAEAEAADYSDIATGERLAPVTPGDVLRHEFMDPLGMSAADVAHETGMVEDRVIGILTGERSIQDECAAMLARGFGTTAAFWTNLQEAHERDLIGPATMDAMLRQRHEEVDWGPPVGREVW